MSRVCGGCATRGWKWRLLTRDGVWRLFSSWIGGWVWGWRWIFKRFGDLLEMWIVLQSDLLQEAETADDGVDSKIEEKNSKCRKILSSVKCALRGSFRKCGFRRLVGPVHEGIHILQVLSTGVPRLAQYEGAKKHNRHEICINNIWVPQSPTWYFHMTGGIHIYFNEKMKFLAWTLTDLWTFLHATHP